MQNPKQNSPFAALFGHSLTGMLLVALLDELVAWEEREVLVQTIANLGPHVTAEQALRFLDETAHMLADCPRERWHDLFAGAEGLPSDHKVMLLGLCTKVAFSDGHLDADEGRLLRQIADWIGIDKAGRAEWKSAVQQALSEAYSRDSVFTGFENLF